MVRLSRPATALAWVLAVAGPSLAPVDVAAQSVSYTGEAPAGAAIAPDMTVLDGTPAATGGEVSSRDATQARQEPNSDPAQPNTPARGGKTASNRLSPYYGTSRANQDLAGASYADDEPQAPSGQTGPKPHRLGVFDQDSGEGRRLAIKPYIEVGQVLDQHLTPDGETLTYSLAAVGVDALVSGRNNQGTVSLRYERRIGEVNTSDTDAVSGVARLSSAIVPDILRLDYGGYANRTFIAGSGASISGAVTSADAVTQIYSVYGGPVLTTHVGEAGVTGHYHIGYTALDTPSGFVAGTPQAGVDVFDHSTVQDAGLAISTRAGEALPVGLAAEGGYHREDVSNLDQRLVDKHVQGEVTLPVAADIALVGGVGYEQVTVTSRDAVRVNGVPQIDANGRYITDYSSPRTIAFDADGLIWDAGVIWHPSRRTHAELHVARRYGEIGVYGSFSYQPNDHSGINLAVYDDVAGFGGDLTNSLSNLPTQFQAVRDPITGNIGGCVAALQSGNCLAGVLGSVNSAFYRSRGATFTYGLDLGKLQTGFGLGYSRREYIASPGTVLASIDGKSDQYYWIAGYLRGHLSHHSGFEATVDAYRFQSGLTSNGDLTAVRAVGIYQHYLSSHLTASASLAIDGLFRQAEDDVWGASGAVGMRYSF